MGDKENQTDNASSSGTSKEPQQDAYNPGQNLPDLDYETYRKSEDGGIRERDYENHRTSK
jgi:hypothetical protein